MKEADPDATMILGPSAGATQWATDSKGYFGEVMDLGARSLIDAVSLHFYPVSYRMDEVSRYLNKMVNLFGRDIPIYITEIGEFVRFSLLPGETVSDQRKAAESLVRNISFLLANYCIKHVAVMPHWGGLDLSSRKSEHIQGPTLARYSYKMLIKKLKDADWQKMDKIKNGEDNLYVYKFHRKNSGENVYVAFWDYFVDHPEEDFPIRSSPPP